MSGHSKWSTIKRQKGANDKVRGAIFTKLGSSITIAVREGGGADPESNFRLRLAIEKARAANMPKDNIQRAIDRALGKLGGAGLETIIYEGFASGGVAVLVEVLTDNKQRMAALIKNTFSTHGGAMGGAGSVSYLFEKVGLLVFSAQDRSSDEILELLLAANAADYEEENNIYTVYTKPQDLHAVKTYLESKNISFDDVELTFKPSTTISITDESTKNRILELLETIDDVDDVTKVHANADFKIE